jgi:hypothetical protein
MARKYKKAWHGIVVWAIVVAFFVLCWLFGYLRERWK